jgi:phosphoserine phosphatase
MTLNAEAKEQFTGLILLTGVDRPGISAALFECLAPFAVSIIDVEQIVISDRLILTVLIALNPSHQKAIETDLEQCAANNDVDIATLFENRQLIPVKTGLVDVVVSAPKMHPATLALVSRSLKDLGVNIENISRSDSTQTTILLTVSNSTYANVKEALSALSFEDGSVIMTKDHS